jgi:hypothetical protein
VLEGWVKTGNVAATFEGALLCLGDTAAQTPHATSCDYVALAGHTLGTDATAVSVISSNDNFATPTTRLTFTPTTIAGADGATLNHDTMRFFTAASASSWRLSFAGGPYSPVPQIQIAALGLSRSLPRGVVAGYDPRGFRPTVETSRGTKGAPLGRLTRQALRRLRVGQPYLTETELDALRDLEQHACHDMLPFFLSWDPGEHIDDASPTNQTLILLNAQQNMLRLTAVRDEHRPGFRGAFGPARILIKLAAAHCGRHHATPLM